MQGALEQGLVGLELFETGSISVIVPTIFAVPGEISDLLNVLFSFGEEQFKSRIDNVKAIMANKNFVIRIVLSHKVDKKIAGWMIWC